jgi:hypothetical protein
VAPTLRDLRRAGLRVASERGAEMRGLVDASDGLRR